MRLYANVESLLRAHALRAVDERPLTHGGFSGAMLTRLNSPNGDAFVLKRMSITRDWIMRATDDAACREAEFALAAPGLGERIRTPTVGVAQDGDTFALLMREVTPDLIPPGQISQPQLQTIIEGMAALHRTPLRAANISWCDLSRRLSLLTPASAAIARSYGAPVAVDIVRGWDLFDDLATAGAGSIIHDFFRDPSPLVRALDRLPTALLHGDLKLDNIGLAASGRMWLIDWALTLVAPAAVELGWFLAINSRRLLVSLDSVMEIYADAARIPADDRAAHDKLTVLCGLVLRGWRKALDADAGEPEELRWWCERGEGAIDIL